MSEGCAEDWRPVASYEGIYEVSDHGRVRRVCGGPGAVAGRVLKNRRTGSKSRLYHLVDLCLSGVRKTYRVHKLVMLAFRGPAPEDEFGELEVHHKDGNLDNNHLRNLEWRSKKENCEEMWQRYIEKGGL